MPFITEEIWHAIYDGKPPLKSIALAAFPQADQKQIDLKAETYMAVLQDLIVSVRNLRAELKVEPKLKVPIQVYAHEAEIRKLIEENSHSVEKQANVESIAYVESSLAKLPGARHTARFDVHLIYEQKIDVASECERLKKELEKLEKDIASGQGRLGNETFLTKAPTTRRKANGKNWAVPDLAFRQSLRTGNWEPHLGLEQPPHHGHSRKRAARRPGDARCDQLRLRRSQPESCRHGHGKAGLHPRGAGSDSRYPGCLCRGGWGGDLAL